MTKSSLLIATAAAALIAGSAFAQSPATPPAQSSPSTGASGAMGGGSNTGANSMGGSMNSGATMDKKSGAASQGGASDAATTGAGPGATTETNKADDFKTKGTADHKSMSDQKGAQHLKSDNKAKSETTGQAPANRSGQSENNVQQRNGAAGKAESGQQTGQSQDMQRSGQGSSDKAGTSRKTNVNVNLSSEQRTRIKEVIVRDKSAPRVANVNFSINVGTTVPRTVTHVVVPSTIVEIHPAWRGFHYFMAGDQIVIIDPATLRIVAVIDA
jgi:hypothetical protein